MVCTDGLKIERGCVQTVACKGACFAFNTDELCCRGEFGSPETCPPSEYSETFKASSFRPGSVMFHALHNS